MTLNGWFTCSDCDRELTDDEGYAISWHSDEGRYEMRFCTDCAEVNGLDEVLFGGDVEVNE